MNHLCETCSPTQARSVADHAYNSFCPARHEMRIGRGVRAANPTKWSVVAPHSSGPAKSKRSAAYKHKGDYDRAIQDYDQALRLNPAYAAALYGRGLAYAQKGDHDRATQDYDQSLRIDSNFANTFVVRGNALRPDRAITSCLPTIREQARVCFIRSLANRIAPPHGRS